MAIRMPSQRKLNLVKDLSILNRYGLEHTTRDGTPLIYRVRVTLHGMTFVGTGPTAEGFRGVRTQDGGKFYASDDSDNDVIIQTSADGFTTIKIDGCQNNWVMKEAAKRFHKAREKMFSDGAIDKGSRGKYSHTIRYNYNGAGDAWLTPVDANSAAFNGGTWDVSNLVYENDDSFQLGLVGSGDDEETNTFTGSYMSIGHAYLCSRANMPADTNPQTSETPAKFSVLRRLLSPDPSITSGSQDNITANARDEQDNPPYEVLDISDSGDIDHDITEPVELGRCSVELGAVSKSMIIDVPFGIMDVRLQHYSQSDHNETLDPVWGVELLKISEMQG